MTKTSSKALSANRTSDDSIAPDAHAGKTEQFELSEHDLAQVSGGYQTGGSGRTFNCPTNVDY
ncbi:bacteriocin [Bradyrhizobium sp. INPA01-394B]|uniref:Bacteriocin n=1 Tax=Bradyrhizobium campsiandrae TaxID=1729892 RepID=A0ABR7UIK5_9BRAD|nr:bacteriocin [Bradyrhizobium campsiandrae]MBC9876890.1 bacteriocin [Bradyrhizobium campsiandrae]MBC9877048.1 bacteriocin [Bradyrhizobium campsiandrae]MBC9983282.1 bacteriocin [Bradyrhizobium campsiandrae]